MFVCSENRGYSTSIFFCIFSLNWKYNSTGIMEIDDQYLYDDYEMEGDEAEEITEVWGVEYVF